ncbi:MAG: CARDB domain-containing protein [Nitrospirota bacterium]
MFKRASRLSFLIGSFLMFLFTSFASAQIPQIPTGLRWLNSAQTTTGNWPAVETTEYYSTSAALDAVYVFEPTSSTYTEGLTWLSSQAVSPTDYLSRRIAALKRAGMDASAEVEVLLYYRDLVVGGWGTHKGFDDGILDTTLALQALRSANYSDFGVLFQAINYLTSNQKNDGGWGFKDDAVSNVYLTATILQMLASYNNVTFNVQSSIDKAVAYLLSKQNADGGFGSSPSKVYESALALDALIASGSNVSAVVPATVNYLTTSQSANGSWNDDPYSTALALRALASVRPNLSVASVSFTNPMPREGETITLTANVRNSGYDSASDIVVRFYLGDPSAGGMQIGVDQILPSLSVNSSSQASISQSFTGTGGKTIFVVADPDNTISETSESDNKSSSRIWVATEPDIAVYSEDLKPSTYVPSAGTAFTLEYKVRNLGESETGAFTISLYDGDPASGGTLLQTGNISGLTGTEVRTGTIGVTLRGDGAHTLYLVADSGNQITELTKASNIA